MRAVVTQADSMLEVRPRQLLKFFDCLAFPCSSRSIDTCPSVHTPLRTALCFRKSSSKCVVYHSYLSVIVVLLRFHLSLLSLSIPLHRRRRFLHVNCPRYRSAAFFVYMPILSMPFVSAVCLPPPSPSRALSLSPAHNVIYRAIRPDVSRDGTYQTKQHNPRRGEKEGEDSGYELRRNLLFGAESVEDFRSRVEEHFVRVLWWWLRGGHCEIK